MAEVQVTINESPNKAVSPALIKHLSALQTQYRSVLRDVPLYEVNGETVYLLAMTDGETLSTRFRSDNRTSVLLEFLTAIEGMPVGYGVDPLDKSLIRELGRVLNGVQFSFTAEVVGYSEYTNCAAEFTEDGLSGRWSTYQADESEDEISEDLLAELRALLTPRAGKQARRKATKKAPTKKAPTKKTPARKAPTKKAPTKKV